MVVVAALRIDPARLTTHDGMEIGAFVPQLYPGSRPPVAWPRPTVPLGRQPHRQTCVRPASDLVAHLP
jgi:hypothetical protein